MDTLEKPPAVEAETQVSVREFRAHLSRYLARAEAGGRIAVTSRGKVVARLGPPEELSMAERRKRAFGCMKGAIWIAPDFDEPLQDMIDSAEADIFPPLA
jgi:prevent-host-death family protein